MTRRRDEVYPWANMQAILDRLGLKSAQLAKRAGLSSSVLYNWKSQNRCGGQGTSYEKLARGAGMEIEDFLAELRGKKGLPLIEVRVLQESDILLLRRQKAVAAATFAHRPSLEGVYSDVETGTLAAVPIEDTSFNRRVPVGGFAIIDWSDRTPVPGRPYLIIHDSRALVRRYRAVPATWLPDSFDEYPPIAADHVDVIARVRSFHTPEN